MQLLKCSDYITVRDINSYNLLKEYGINSSLCSDPVWNFEKINSEKNNKLGIQLREFTNINDDFLLSLASSVNKYYGDENIVLLSLQNKLDFEISKRFKEILLKINPNLNIEIAENCSNEKTAKEIAGLKALIAMRYHANLIAIKNKVKTLPIAYDIKVKTLAEDFNIDCINPDTPDKIDEKLAEFKNKPISYDENQINNLKFDFNELIKHI